MTANECEFPAFSTPDSEIQKILKNARNIAVIGCSPKEGRPSGEIAEYLQNHGYKIFPVNPHFSEILGEKCVAHLNEIKEPIDIVDIFRRPEYIPEIVSEAIEIGAKTIWMQLGIVNNNAAQQARDAGLHVIMNRCIKVDHMGFNFD